MAKLTWEVALPDLQSHCRCGGESTSEESRGEGETHIDDAGLCKDRRAQLVGRSKKATTSVRERRDK